MGRLASTAVLAGLTGAAACAPPAALPAVDVVVLNPTGDAADARTWVSTPDANGGTEGDIAPCDVGGAFFELVGGDAWSVTVNGMTVVESGDPLPEVRAGQTLSLVVLVQANGRATLESVDVIATETEEQSRERLERLRDALGCVGPAP